MKNKDYSRRKFLNKLLGIGGVFSGGTLLIVGCDADRSSSVEEHGDVKKGISEDPCNELFGVSEDELRKRESLGYTTKTQVSGSFCGNCSLYIPPSSEAGCGGCILFKGPVNADGYCVQYVAKT